MKISKQARREARQLFRGCLSNGGIDENRARQTVQLLAQKKPRGYMGILSQFQKLVRLNAAERVARVESAVALDSAMQAEIRADLGRIYGAGLNFTFTQKPELLGGMRIQVGGDVYNGSVLSRLNALRESF